MYKPEDMVITSHICRGNYYSTFSGSVSPCLRQNTIYKNTNYIKCLRENYFTFTVFTLLYAP